MCKELDIHCISLSHFTDKEKYGEFISEPTKKGAKDIANLICKMDRRIQINTFFTLVLSVKILNNSRNQETKKITSFCIHL
jgi:hypothetical protein